MNELKRHLKKLAVILPALMIFAMPSNVFASEVEQHEDEEEHVDFAAQVEFIRGHLMQAVANKEANKIDLATAHAGHPAAEHFAAMESEIMKHNKAIHDELQTVLDQLPNKVKALNSTDFKKETDRIDALLENAVRASVPASMRDDSTFWIKVAIKLLETTEHEYEEGVSGGEVKEMIEYQDAQGFAARAETIFNSIGSKINDHSREELEKFFADLNSAINSAQEPEQIETFIDAIVNEFREIAGIEYETAGQPSIANIKALLDKLLDEYKEGEYEEAEQLSVKAYLDNYEFFEAEIEEKDPELMESTEVMLREELRSMIKNHDPLEQIDAKIERINVNLDKILALGIGIAEEEKGDARLAYVKNIRMLLAKVVEEYEEGEYEEASSFAVKAYLDNYEYLEKDVGAQNEELNKEIEHMLRDELREKINNKVPVAEVKELASEINTKLDAVEVIVPEFPVGLTVALASIVSAMVALTRIKGHNLRMP